MIGPDWRQNPDRYFDYIGDRDWYSKFPTRVIYWRCRECGGSFAATHMADVREEREVATFEFAVGVFGICNCGARDTKKPKLEEPAEVVLGISREQINARKELRRRRRRGPGRGEDPS